MPYLTILEKLVTNVPATIGAILIDWEGEAVQEVCHCPPYDIRFMAAHQAIILNRLREVARSGGTVEDFVISTDRARLIIGCIDDDYSLMMSVQRSCPMARALYHFRGAIAELRREI